MNAFAVREAGDAAVLLQFAAAIDPEVNARAIAVATVIRQRSLRGVRDVVPTFRSVAVHFDPLDADAGEIEAALAAAVDTVPVTSGGRHHRIPVAYGGEAGPDLEAVAAAAGLSPGDVINRHATRAYRVFMLGFQPGFAYLGIVDPSIATPRRAIPRLRVPAGSVGIAAQQTAVYPAESPGGWQIIGRALEPVFDPTRESPRFAPGDTVMFVPATGSPPTTPVVADSIEAARRVTVIRPGLFTTVQDGGRWGRQHSGFPVSGALDRVSHALANRAVGNAPEAGALEITLAGPELRLEQPTLVAVSGAELAASLDGHPVEVLTPIEASAGSMLRFGNRTRGARAYVAFAGGVTSLRRWPVRPLAAGQVLPLNSAVPAARGVVHARPALPNGGARLRVMRGPQDDQLPADAFDILVRSRFTISPQSNRIGFRLSGPAVPAAPGGMISDATFPGGVQIPPSGEPILLMADRQTTGGYPQLAVVITADLPVAGQLLPGDWVEFVPTTRAEAIEALTAQDAMVRDAR